MKKIIFIFAILYVLFAAGVFGADSKEVKPDRIFHEANSLYEKGDYANAVEHYAKIVDAGLESGALYYNIGNAFFKLGKPGYAILFYEKALRLIPRDGDLKANLAYARSLTESQYSSEQYENVFIRFAKRLFKNFNLTELSITAAFFYLVLLIMLAPAAAGPLAVRKIYIIILISSAAFISALAGFSIRYYNEDVLRHAIILLKDVQCKFEPIDESTTYYNLKEGSPVLILKTHNEWTQIRRMDGKIAWVKNDAVGGM